MKFKKEIKSTQMTIRVSEAENNKLKRLAGELPVSKFFWRLVDEYEKNIKESQK